MPGSKRQAGKALVSGGTGVISTSIIGILFASQRLAATGRFQVGSKFRTLAGIEVRKKMLIRVIARHAWKRPQL
jgi:hypothetical protein